MKSLLPVLLSLIFGTPAAAGETPLNLASQHELFVDDHLIASMDGVALKMHKPQAQEVVLTCDAPWEGNTSAYFTFFEDGGLYRVYYRGSHFDETSKKSSHVETACYAESRDGLNWTKPNLGLMEFNGSKENNIVLIGEGCHNFAPFKDTNPRCPPESRYKALARAGAGLRAWQSSDGIRWSRIRKEPVITAGAFDSQNLAFYDAKLGAYRSYWRYFRGGVPDGRGKMTPRLRDIRTAISKDFLTWFDQADLQYGSAPDEQLYTNAIQPYARAQHLLIGFPTRYEPKHSQVEPVLMTSRDGVNFRRWPEPVIPIDAPQDRDGNRSNYMALGLLSLPGDAGLSVYGTEAYYKGRGSRVRRFSYRMDGFASASAQEKGTLVTKTLTFSGAKLTLNVVSKRTTRVEVQDAAGKAYPGFQLSDCIPIQGDFIKQEVRWKEAKVESLAGKAVRLHFELQEADLFALQFTQ
jgi:hypothetical protein